MKAALPICRRRRKRKSRCAPFTPIHAKSTGLPFGRDVTREREGGKEGKGRGPHPAVCAQPFSCAFNYKSATPHSLSLSLSLFSSRSAAMHTFQETFKLYYIHYGTFSRLGFHSSSFITNNTRASRPTRLHSQRAIYFPLK